VLRLDGKNTSSRDELVAMLPSERPSFSNYMRTHTREEAAERLWDGMMSQKNKETGIIGRVREFFWPPQSRVKKEYRGLEGLAWHSSNGADFISRG